MQLNQVQAKKTLKRDVERAVRVHEVSGRMERESGERGAPARVRPTLAGCRHCVARLIILDEIANSLSGDPAIARDALRSLREPFE